MGVLLSLIGTERVVSGHGACPCAFLILSAGLWGLLTVGSCAKITSFAQKHPLDFLEPSLCEREVCHVSKTMARRHTCRREEQRFGGVHGRATSSSVAVVVHR